MRRITVLGAGLIVACAMSATLAGAASAKEALLLTDHGGPFEVNEEVHNELNFDYGICTQSARGSLLSNDKPKDKAQVGTSTRRNAASDSSQSGGVAQVQLSVNGTMTVKMKPKLVIGVLKYPCFYAFGKITLRLRRGDRRSDR